MEFTLTYEGQLLSTGNEWRDTPRPTKAENIHTIRKTFHKQLKTLWNSQKVLIDVKDDPFFETFDREGFKWKPISTEKNKILCGLDVLFLRPGDPGKVRWDIDNRLKTIFDALRLAEKPGELMTPEGTKQIPEADENPFFVLLQDDSLITHLGVTADKLLQPIDGVPYEESARVVISVRLRPHGGYLETLGFA